jgi:hypothetical protein
MPPHTGPDMRLVLDSNMLQSDSLREFLAKSRKHRAIITDYLMIEALKGDPLGKAVGHMKILCEFPKQVIVLKNLRNLSTLKGRRSGMTRRMIEEDQTRGYENWCAGLTRAEAGDCNYRKQLVEIGKEADAQMNMLVAAQDRYAEIVASEALNYSEDELRVLRTDQRYTPQIVDKMAARVVMLTARFFESHPDNPRTPTVWELPYTYMFRLAVCAYLQTLSRVRDGGAQEVSPKKIANDIVDATLVAQATYFQGLMSNDQKANALYQNSKHVLKAFPMSHAKLMKISK